MWREAMSNPDYRMYPHLFHLLGFKGQHMPRVFDTLIDPYDHEEYAVDANGRSLRSIFSRVAPGFAKTCVWR
ncbi:MAG: hypothetical protein JO163_18915 [Methylobacteriaceae bacterium]|nr:hypothetical protein [Methylobacteriaceae bacterium]